MTRQRTQPKPSKPSHAQDRERVHEEEREQVIGPFWQAVRLSYPEHVREVVDQLSATAVSLTLADLKILGIATERLVADRADYAWREEQLRASAQLTSVQLQYQKHLRHICALEGPGRDLSDQPVVLPEGMSYEELVARAERVDAEGDEIMS